MRKGLLGLIWIGILLWHSAPLAHGQKAVEIFIPLGQSPGLSGTVTVIGKIEMVDPQQRTLKIAGPGETWSAQVTDRTMIWLDRSQLRLANQAGRLTDLKQGLLVEVKYQDTAHKGRGPAEWIKVQLTESGTR